MYQLKLIILYLAKYLGLFFLARLLTNNGLRILCYHGFSMDDEHLFRPKLFIAEETFRYRLNKIAQMGFSVITLDHAVTSLQNGEKLTNALVFTVDDGWQSVETIGAPLFAEHKFPWTLYLTTYYVKKQTQVTNVAIQYLCWKTNRTEFNLNEVEDTLDEVFLCANQTTKSILSNRLIELHYKIYTAEKRQAFVNKLAIALNVAQPPIHARRMFHLMTTESIHQMSEEGVDIQLHTHHHTLGNGSQQEIDSEILSNRKFIEDTCHRPALHFCYPNGIYRKSNFADLLALGVRSATTCNAGLNYKTTHIMELNRFLDSENISRIEFESELSGFSQLIRLIRNQHPQSH